MKRTKNIALVAHDHRKRDLVEWVEWNHLILLKHKLYCTGTTGRLVVQALERMHARAQSNGVDFDNGARASLSVPPVESTFHVQMTLLKSGPLGGDQQLGAMICEGKIDIVIFFWDPMQPQPHEVDVKALLRIAVLYNVPTACNRSTADFLISSPLLNDTYTPAPADYSNYLNRPV